MWVVSFTPRQLYLRGNCPPGLKNGPQNQFGHDGDEQNSLSCRISAKEFQTVPGTGRMFQTVPGTGRMPLFTGVSCGITWRRGANKSTRTGMQLLALRGITAGLAARDLPHHNTRQTMEGKLQLQPFFWQQNSRWNELSFITCFQLRY
jgi:hypothetical protein